jgi:hypothetical protein
MIYKLVASLALLAGAAAASGFGAEETEWLLRKEFEDFKLKFNKVYTTVQEEEAKFQIFRKNMEELAHISMESKSNVWGVTKFFDMSKEEFAARYLTYRALDTPADVPVVDDVAAAPSSFDWRSGHGNVMTAVKNQGGCGSCWAFSATETIESAWAIAGHSLTEFAPQQLVSCDSTDSGCRGGWTEHAFDWIKQNGGMASESAYPYTSGTFPYRAGTCQSVSVSGGAISSWAYATTPCTRGACTSQDEQTMAANLAAKQPLSICVNASKWSYYTGGVLKASDCSGGASDLDHCVQAVAYSGKDSSSGYWVVRNSWDSDWGEDGYIRLEFGKNTCGVADDAIFVTIK